MAGDDTGGAGYFEANSGQPIIMESQPAPAANIEKAQEFIKSHREAAGQYRANFEDLMRQRTDAVKAAGDELNKTIAELRARHDGANGGINLPLLALGAGMLSTPGNFGQQLGTGLKSMGDVIQKQRMSDTDFLQGIASLQQRQQALNDVPFKDASMLAREGQLKEEGNVANLEKAIITSKADRPQSLGGGLFYYPGKGVVNGYNGQVIMGEPGAVGPDGKPLQNTSMPGMDLVGTDTHGADFLKSIKDPVMRDYIKAIGDYDAPPPPAGGRSPMSAQYQEMLFSLAKQYNPDFNSQDYATIQKGKKDWTGGGKQATLINSGVTAAGHLANLQEGAARLGGGTLAKFNTVGNWIKNNTGSPEVKQFQADLNIVSNELAKFLGGGKPAEAEISEWRNAINAADSPAALQGVIQEMARAMHTQLETQAAAKTRDFGGRHEFTPEELLGTHADLMKSIFANDISTPGGRYSVLRRAQNSERQLGGKEGLPTPTAEQWSRGVEMLQKSPTPDMRKKFDEAFGEGSAKMVLGK